MQRLAHCENSLGEPLPVMRLDPSAVPGQHRFDAWREYQRPICDVRPIANGAPGKDAPTAVADARQAAMRRHIERNLHDLGLGVESLCRAFGVSRATLYREFATESGIARYITRRRLDWAFRELASRPPARGRVRAACERWGFDSASHFNRLFRARFGISPSDAMSLGEEPAPAAPSPGLDRCQFLDLRPWLRRI